jgi:hypothetical protein
MQTGETGTPPSPTADATSVWLIVYGAHGQIWTVPTGLAAPRPFAQGGTLPLDLALRGDSLWSIDVHGTVRRYDAHLGDLQAVIKTAPTVRSSIAVGEGAVWVATEHPS